MDVYTLSSLMKIVLCSLLNLKPNIAHSLSVQHGDSHNAASIS